MLNTCETKVLEQEKVTRQDVIDFGLREFDDVDRLLYGGTDLRRKGPDEFHRDSMVTVIRSSVQKRVEQNWVVSKLPHSDFHALASTMWEPLVAIRRCKLANNRGETMPVDVIAENEKRELLLEAIEPQPPGVFFGRRYGPTCPWRFYVIDSTHTKVIAANEGVNHLMIDPREWFSTMFGNRDCQECHTHDEFDAVFSASLQE